ncbi:hypothetical protein [Burkholderia cepacia]|uniref:hypothetical protein n=1 Tax=Burkholderia cepacia TaxID=292 RepID=UPI001FC7F1B7|nr:hypothetical protein [Burkholderia cepacia]
MLQKLQQCASAYGWRCLSEAWSDSNASYSFVCECGHVFERIARPLLYRQTAPKCAECEAEDLRQRWFATVSARGGALVKGVFTGLQPRYQLRCDDGHEWEAQGRKIAEGSWCPTCAKAERAEQNRHADGLARLHAAAEAKGGRCLAADYTIGRRRYPFECAQGHRWKAEGYEVLRGRWCGRCAKRANAACQTIDRNGLKRLQDAASKQGGQCLATEYRGSTGKYPFRCAAGHEWQAVASQIWVGHWRRRCANPKLRNSIEDMQALAATRGGLCLSAEYHGKRVKLTWQCHRGHVWETRPLNVRAGKWCSQCAILDRVRAKNNWKRKRYETTGKLPI